MTSQVPIWRTLVAAGLALVALGGLSMSAPREWWILALPMGLLLFSGPVAFVPRLGPQLLARAIWWANLALGTVLSLVGSGRERRAGLVMVLACGSALLVVGRKGLAEATEAAGYAPAAFRSSLLLLMVFALADAQTFLLFGIVSANGGGREVALAVPMLAIGMAYVIGFVGLYRLKVWAALLNVGVSFVALVTSPVLIREADLRLFIAVVAVSHCLVATPMLLALVAKRPIPALSARARGVGQVVAIGGLMLASFISWATR